MPDSDLDIVLSSFDAAESSIDEVKRSKRWEKPFGEITEADVLDILGREPFKTMCPDLESAKREAFISFGVPISVYGILMNDTRIREVKRGEFVMRRGDYGNSAFYLLEGKLRHIGRPHLSDSLLGRRSPTRKSFVTSLISRIYDLLRPMPPEYRKAQRAREVRDDDGKGVTEEQLQKVLEPGKDDTKYDTVELRPGDIFGEIGAIYRTPRPYTVVAEEDSRVLEVRWQGLRDLMDIDPTLSHHIQGLYRKYRLRQDIENIPYLAGLSEEQLAQVQFKTFGKYDEWSSDYLDLAPEERTSVIETEEVIASEGDYPNGIYIVQGGFARESRRYGHGHQTINYLTTGQVFGLQEILYNYKHRRHPIPFQHTLRAIAYAHVLFVPTRIVEEHALPRLPEDEKRRMLRLISPKDKGVSASAEGGRGAVGADLLEFLVEHRFLIGTQTMLINMDRCTRCDDCVRACAAAHDGNPRFVRYGPIHGNFMVANACMHCADPVCMIGCPTGAIHRETIKGYVVINEETCIGCATCYSNCPYDAIRMTAVRDGKGEFKLATAGEDKGLPIYKASKCDLCVDQPGGPSCERACPHDALRRVNMQNMKALSDFVRQ